jgi:hypothetical protein
MIVFYTLNTKLGQRLYYKRCFSKQTFSLTKKISKPLSARPQAAPFFCPLTLYRVSSAGCGRGLQLQAPVLHDVVPRVHG